MSLTINLLVLFMLLFVHWLGDAVLQSDTMAQNKYRDFSKLTLHTFIYSGVFFPFLYLSTLGHYTVWCYLAFMAITFVIHTTIDFFTSKGTRALGLRAKQTGNYHDFFVLILFDQLLHAVQLVLTYNLIFQ